jgi:putative ABC transport system permease protein
VKVQNHLSEAWEKVYPNLPMESYFLDQHFFESYEADEKRSKVFTLFSAITIFIACIGLLGLASFSTEQRTKEIGIRKVIGATEFNIISLLTREFFILVLISMLFAFAGAYFLMSRWLSDSFVYHTEMKWLSFAYSGLIALFFVLLTVGVQAFRAANSNPVDALRTE